jgi:RND family efflux transporter MFP subunit
MDEKPKNRLRVLTFILGGLVLILLITYMGGFWTRGKIGPGRVKKASLESFQPQNTSRAEIQKIMEYYEAVGTVRPQTETKIEAQVTGRILEVLVRPGEAVIKGKPLVVLDTREFQARVDQARQDLTSAEARREQSKQAVLAAQAAYSQAESAYKRVKKYVESEAATKQELEQAESAFLQAKAKLRQAADGQKEAEAGVNRARKVIEESRIALDYNRIKAQENGQVVKRLVEPGDLAWPGKPLIVLQTREALRLEALVREGLIHKVSPGTSLQVYVSALDRTMEGTVEEIIPSADPATRTFLVKVRFPPQKDLYPGMFGRLLVPIEEKEVVAVPDSAVKRMGQLEVVMIEEKGEWKEIFIKTGRRLMGEKVEIISGLKGDETIALLGGTDA